MNSETSTIHTGRIEIQNCYDETGIPNLKTTGNPRVQESHPEREILMVISGKSNFLLNGKIYSAVPGDVFFINPWIPHQCNYGTFKTDFKHIWLHFHEQRLFGVLYQNSIYQKSSTTTTWEHSKHLLSFLNERWDRALTEPEHSVQRTEIYMSIARILAEEIHYLSNDTTGKTNSRNEQVVCWIKNYISMQYGRNASLPELEKLTGYNRFYLMRLFKAEYGMTIGEYINCVRRGFVTAARQQHLPQKEIAQHLGFQSAAAFWLWKKRDDIRKSKSARPEQENSSSNSKD